MSYDMLGTQEPLIIPAFPTSAFVPLLGIEATLDLCSALTPPCITLLCTALLNYIAQTTTQLRAGYTHLAELTDRDKWTAHL